MKKYCPNCRSIIKEPSQSDIFKYAKYWRDNKCYVCDTSLINPKNNQRNSVATVFGETSQTSSKKKRRWGWAIFLVVLFIITYLIYKSNSTMNIGDKVLLTSSFLPIDEDALDALIRFSAENDIKGTMSLVDSKRILFINDTVQVLIINSKPSLNRRIGEPSYKKKEIFLVKVLSGSETGKEGWVYEEFINKL